MPGRWLAAQGRLPLAFMGLGLIWLVVATGFLLWAPETLALPHPHPHVVALTHAWVLGFFVTVACGAVYQLAPVALGATLASERYGWWHLGLHAFGVPGMVWSFWHWDLKLLGHFGFAVALGILLFAVNTWRTVWRWEGKGTVAWSLLLAAGWLLTTVLLGLLLVSNRYWEFIPLDSLALLRAHAHIGLLGFFLTLLQGVGFQLVPMFTLGEVRNWRLANAGLWLTQTGLLGLTPAFVWHFQPLAQDAAVVIVTGIVCSGIGLRRALATRKRCKLEPGVQSFLCGGIGLGVAAGVGLAVLLSGSDGSQAGGCRAMFYAILIIFGGLLPCFAGLMCKIVPFLVWTRTYGPRAGRGAVPSASALANARIERWGLLLMGCSVFSFLVGVWTLQDGWLRAGAWILAAGVLLFVTDMLGVLRHLWRSPIPNPAEGPPPSL